jgi:hypothetical protein
LEKNTYHQQEVTEENVQMKMIWLFVIPIFLDNRGIVFGRDRLLFHWGKLASSDH